MSEKPTSDAPTCFVFDPDDPNGPVQHVFVLGQRRCSCGKEMAPEPPPSREVRAR